jgi:hypothetical protein
MSVDCKLDARRVVLGADDRSRRRSANWQANARFAGPSSAATL